MGKILSADFNQYYKLLPSHQSGWSHFLFFLSCQGMWAILDYRCRRWLCRQSRLVRWVCWIPAFFSHIIVQTLTGISLPTGCDIGKGLYIGHFGGIFVYDTVVMGERCSLSQGVSIGLGGKEHALGAPRIGNHVYFGAGAKVLGKITIGNNVRIGANAVVLASVPDGATAVGVPAKIISPGGADASTV